MPFNLWSKIAANNSNADPSINWSAGMSPSSVEPSGRAMMAASAQWRDDISGTITTGGTSTAYTVASNQVFTTLALMNGAMIAFVPHATNGGVCTLNVDGLGAKPLRSAPGLEIGAGVLIQGTPYVVTYNNSDAAFYLQGFVGNPFNTPIGGLMPYAGSTAPNSNFSLAYGAAISRTTYATLFALIGTTYGAGDGVTTFTIPDLRGRTIFGLDNMGGSTASRVTSSGSGISGTTLGAAGGFESNTLTAGNIPSLAINATLNPADLYQRRGGGAVGVSSGGGVSVYPVSSLQDTSPTISGTVGGAPASYGAMPPALILTWIIRII